MLTKMRQSASSWPAKIFLVAIALSFVGWGVGDMVVNRGETTVAEAGSAEIDIRDLQIAYRNRIQSLQQAGTQVTPGSELAQALVRAVLDGLILDALENVVADGFAIAISDDTLRVDIASNDLFANQAGAFDAAVFAGVLATSGLTEESYLAALASGLRREQLMASLGAVPPLPGVLADRIFRHRFERRAAEIAVVANDALASAPPPTPGELESFFEAHLAHYDAPEYRSADYLLVYPEDLASRMEVAEATLREAYDASPDSWVEAERRLLERISFATEEEAQAAFEAIRGGATFANVALEHAGIESDELEFGWLARGDLFAELAEPLFAADEGETVAPLASPLGDWLLFRIAGSQPEKVVPFKEARERIAEDIKTRRARAAMFDLAGDMDDLIATGASVQETASALELDARTLQRVSREGLSEDPLSLQIVPEVPGFLDELFLGEVDFPSTVIETEDGGLLVMEVTEIAAARQRSFPEVETIVRGDWQRIRLAERAAEAARAIAGATGAMDDLDAAYGGAGASFAVSTPFQRDEDPGIDGVGPDAVAAIFAALPGEVVVAPSTDGAGQVIARLSEIVTADPAADPEDLAAMERSLQDGWTADVVRQHGIALRRDTPVAIDRRLLEQYF